MQAQSDSDLDGIPDAKEEELARLYTPLLQFKLGERFFPVDVKYQLENSVLKLRRGEDVTLVDEKPSIEKISTYTDEEYFLDNRLGGLEEIARDYSLKRDKLGYTVYAHVTREQGFTVVQYWLFYAYNDGRLNKHEGDWEMIEVILDGSEPVSAVYSQHLTGQRASWSDVEKFEGTHPKVYVALGSHANYFRPYQGKLGAENDEVGVDGLRILPSQVNLVVLGELGRGKHPESQDWLDFGGRWGDWAEIGDAVIGFAGPHGPGHGENREKWVNPVSWSRKLHRVDDFWFILSWAASNFLLLFLAATAGICLLKGWRIVKAKREGRLRFLAIVKSRASLGISLRVVGLALTMVAAFLPWYTLKAGIQTSLVSTEGVVNLLVVDGLRGVQVNLLDRGRLTPFLGFQAPFGLLLLAGIVISVLDMIGAEDAGSLGNRYIVSGIAFFILFGVLFALISQVISTLPSLASSFETQLPPESLEIARTVARQPFQGEAFYSMGGLGSIYLYWGLDIGAYALMLSAALSVVGGALLKVLAGKSRGRYKA
ncbi:Vps62-related protein [Candidatus Bathyarchaeota archaeon]|nr:Vps62-related protein [Candidatus Bathyarchaeota archaeon]